MVAWIRPDWSAPSHIHAGTTRRTPAGFNLATHVNDDLKKVHDNREQLAQDVGCPIHWLDQSHSTTVINLDKQLLHAGDAACTTRSQLACAVLTADCLPVIATDESGVWVAAIHAGWRGLCEGIIQKTLALAPAGKLHIWLGPAIGPRVYEVDEVVRQAFCAKDKTYASAFTATRPKHYLLDLYTIARRQCAHFDATLTGGTYCTYSQQNEFYSYRRQGQTGRQATLIWKTR